jgi:hypothetical protein
VNIAFLVALQMGIVQEQQKKIEEIQLEIVHFETVLLEELVAII